MIQPAFEILNQRGTPMFFSDVFANRPTAGIVGRIFISTDTYAFYRDTGSGWDLIGGPGTGTITGSGAVSQVAFWSGSSTITGENNLWWDFTNNHFGINTNTPGTAADIHHDQSTILQLNQTTAANDTRIAFQNSGTALWRIGNFYNAGANDWGIYDVIGAIQPLTIAKTTGQTFIGSKTTASGRLVVNSASSDAHIQVVGASAPSIRIDNAGSGATQRLVFGLATATNNFIQGSTAGDICISTASSSPLLFGMWQTINATEVMRISTTNNLIVGSTTDNGNRLQVNGNVSATGNYQGLNGSLSGYLQIGSTHSVKLDITQSLSYDGIRIISNNPTTQNLLQLYHNDSYGVIETTYLGSGAYKNLLLNTQGGNVLVGNGTAGSEKLQIFGNGYFSSNVAIGGITASTILDINPASNSATDGIRIQRHNVNTYTLITSYNSVSSISAVDINSGTPILAFFRSTDGTSFTENARFSAAGNLLVGTTTDSGYKFEVNGSAKVSSIRTDIPTSGVSNPPWKLGSYQTNAVIFDTAHYVEIEINGVGYRLALAL